MAYFIVSKAQDSNGKRGLIDTLNNREEARAKARELNGTVKTQAEYDDMLAAGDINTGEIAEVTLTLTHVPAMTTEEAAQYRAENPEAAALVDADIAEAKAEILADDMRSEEQKASDAAAVNPILAAAAEIAKAPKIKTTVGKAEKAAPKRVVTAPATLQQAKDEFKAFAKTNPTKVQLVRWLAAWNNNALQRRDVFALVADFPVDLDIADATVSTQFQLVRSGKAPKAK